jgi:hypothetical protein
MKQHHQHPETTNLYGITLYLSYTIACQNKVLFWAVL